MTGIPLYWEGEWLPLELCCWSMIASSKSFSDGWEDISCFFSAGLDWYPIRTLQWHAHINPLLYHQSDLFAWIIVISSQSCVSCTAWVLNNIIAPKRPAIYHTIGPLEGPVGESWEWLIDTYSLPTLQFRPTKGMIGIWYALPNWR